MGRGGEIQETRGSREDVDRCGEGEGPEVLCGEETNKKVDSKLLCCRGKNII